MAPELETRNPSTETYERRKRPLGFTVLIAALFLAPYLRLMVIPGYGFSLGDALLVLGGILGAIDTAFSRNRSHVTDPRRLGSTLMIPGLLIVTGVIFSALANESATTFNTIVLVGQYGLAFVLFPIILCRFSKSQIHVLMLAYCYGLAISVAVGLLVITLFPGMASTLISHGYLYAKANGRQGLFAGVGELAKMCAMGFPLVYFLALSNKLSLLRAALICSAFITGLLVSRSGLGAIAAGVAIATIALLHAALRPKVSGQPGRTTSRAVAALALTTIAASFIIGRLDSLGQNYSADFVARILDPWTQGGVESIGSGQERIGLVGEAFQVINAHPLAGVGPGVYANQSAYGVGVHVVPLMLWGETGLLALAGWVVLMVLVGLAIARSLRRYRLAAVAAGAVFGAFLITSFSMPYVYQRGLFAPLLLVYFCLAGSSHQSTPYSSKTAAGKRGSAPTSITPAVSTTP